MKFTELLNQLNIPIAPEGHHHARTGWVQIDCPFCGKDSKRWHLGYSLDENYVNCWKCGSHPLVTALMELTGFSFRKCKKLLDELDSTEVERSEIKGKLVVPKGVGELLPAHKRYLRGRGFNPKELKRLWGVQGIGIAKRLSWRIFIPINYKGEMVSWATRSISKSGKITRYISAALEEESFPHRDLLYGEHYVRYSIIITEGPFDVWRIGKGAVATLGTGYSQAQVNRIVKYPVRVVCFDNDKNAQRRAQRLCNDISVFPGDTYNITLDSKDAGEAGKREIEQIREGFLE